MSGCMPAVVSRTVRSSARGTSDAEGRNVWPFDSKKARKPARSSADVRITRFYEPGLPPRCVSRPTDVASPGHGIWGWRGECCCRDTAAIRVVMRHRSIEKGDFMRERISSRRSHLWVVLLSALGALTLIAPLNASAITPAQCDARANDTPSKLVECIQQGDLMAHMQAFQDIADANPSPDGMPSRNSGEPGYAASVDYVKNLMMQAGYDVTIQTYKFTYYAWVGIPTFSEVSPSAHNYQVVSDWYPGKVNTGFATGDIQPAGGIVLPPTQTPSSSSGCAATDFNGFVPGRIALIQRGGCFYGIKVLNAQAAGAAGVIIFNEGNPGRTDATPGVFFDPAGNEFIPTIPVAFASFAVGSDLYNQYQQAVHDAAPLPVVSLSISAIIDPNRDDYNVIADSKGGDKNHVMVVDAHLDAIYGAGMLDNASGSATILDVAQMMKNVDPLNKLRFIWFGGEELGLLGSCGYVQGLS